MNGPDPISAMIICLTGLVGLYMILNWRKNERNRKDDDGDDWWRGGGGDPDGDPDFDPYLLPSDPVSGGDPGYFGPTLHPGQSELPLRPKLLSTKPTEVGRHARV